MANTLADLIRPRRNLGFAGQEGELLNMLAMAPEDQMQPMNTIRTSSGEYITPGGGRSMQPVEFGGSPQPQFRGSPVDVFGQGKGYMQPDGTIVGVNAQGQRFAVNPAGTAAAGQAAKDAELKRRMMQAQVATEEARARGDVAGTKAPSGYRFTQTGELEPIPGGPADLKAQMLAMQKGQATEQASITSQQAIDQAAELFAHPGRAAATGASSFLSKIPGTEAKGFEANLNTFKAQTFIPMVSALKGMGALSDAEGKKLAESVGALDPSMPEKEFENSLRKITRTLYDKAKASGLNVSLPDFAAGGVAGNSVTAPDGSVHNFPNAAAADAFRKAIGM